MSGKQPSSLPRRIAWFAPWTWKRRWKIAAILIAVLAYPLGMTPVMAVAFKLQARGWLPDIVIKWLLHAQTPLEFAANLTPGANQLSVQYADCWHWIITQTGL